MGIKRITIRRLVGDFGDSGHVFLHQTGCCCCCCCIQVPVSIACGLLATWPLMGLGHLPMHQRRRWPVVIRLIGMAILLGTIEGLITLAMWPGWDNHFLIYFLGSIAPVVPALVAMTIALRKDGPFRAMFGLRAKVGRSLLLTTALSVALGSLCISALYGIDRSAPSIGVVSYSVATSVLMGFILGYHVARVDCQQNPVHPEARFARLTGGLIGANFGALIVAGSLLIVAKEGIELMTTAMVVMIGGAVASALVSRAKFNRHAIAGHRGVSVFFALADGVVAATAGLLLLRLCSGGSNSSEGEVVTCIGALGGALLGGVMGELTKIHPPVPVADAGPEWTLFCPHCAYNLTGLPVPRCPECGHPFDEAQLRQASQRVLFPMTMWHPLSTSPLGGALLGAGLAALLYAVL